MSRLSCVIIGEQSLAIGCGDMLAERGHDIAAVITRDSGVAAWASARGLPVLERIAALVERFAPGAFDWLLSIANLSVIPDPVLALAGKGAVNFHDGPLPRHAGLNAPAWAIMAGDCDFGISWHLIEGGIDAGDIVVARQIDIAPDDTAFSLNSKCYGAGLDSFAEVIDGLETGAPPRRRQDPGRRSYHARGERPAAAGRLNFGRDAQVLAAQVRGLDFGDRWNPLTTAKIEAGGRVILVARAKTAETAGPAAPGTVLDMDPSGLSVATARGAVKLSGFADATGAPVAMADLVGVGSVLPSPDSRRAERLGDTVSRTLKGEAHWRRVLRSLRPVPVPLAAHGAGGAAKWAARKIALPNGLDEAGAIAAVMGFALAGCGDDAADLALSDGAMTGAARAAPGYVSRWVPIRAEASPSVAETRARIAADLERIARLGGFACDLIARDPAISRSAIPGLGLALDDAGPIDGTCATIAIGTGSVTLHVDGARLDERAAQLLAARLETALAAVAAGGHDDSPLADLPVLPDAERRTMLRDWNATARDYDRDQTLHGAFEAQVARTPDATALVFEASEMSYGALNARANALAARLRAAGVAPGVHVGLFVTRSFDLLIGALAILKAGGAYVPLDPSYPADRLAHYIADSAAQVIVTQAALKPALPHCDAQVIVIRDTSGDEGGANVDGGATADDLAYLIYTSGSTGTPKGVMVEHRNLANFFAGMDDRIEHEAGGVWLAVTSLNFDISVLELFWTLARGFKVVLSGEGNRAVVSNGPLRVSDRRIEFNLMYWGNDDGPGPKKYQLLLDGAKFADTHGFNAIWTPERHFHAFGGPYPNPSVTGAAVAAVTRNLSVRSSSVVAPLHHPARIAEEWAIIDNLTDGRAGLGIASGWQPNDFVLRPENTPPDNKPAMYATIETVRRLWRGEAVEFAHKDGRTHAVITQPRPVSRELPIWLTIAGNPDTWREAGEIGANVLTHLLGQSIDEVAGKIRIYHAALRKAGHDPADFIVTLMLHTYIAETRQQAADVARGPMKAYLTSAAGLIKQFAWAFPAFKRPKGVNNAFELDLGVLEPADVEAILDYAFDRYFDESGLFGTIEDGIARAEQLKRIGVGEIACLIDYGIAPDLVLEGLKPLAEVLKGANAPSELAADDFSLTAQILRHGVTHLQCTPSMARMLSMNDEARLALGHVEQLLIGGEALAGDLVEDLRECTSATIANMYGPTETTVWSTVGIPGRVSRGTLGIGSPIANTSVYVLDPGRRPVPVGVPGELWIGGEGVSRGYWQRPGLTDERFRPDPFADKAGLTVAAAPRMYRTGDLVRWGADGCLDFLGRGDHQVKIRGQRIELGEIEAVIAAFPGVGAAVVEARKIAGDTRLVGYVTARGAVVDTALRAHLQRHLPEAMVPAHIVTLAEFPLTPNQKIDRKALPDPTPKRAAAAAAARMPDGGVEAGIAAIWSRILGVCDIGREDNFFTLGGHSLLAVQAHRELRDRLKLPKLSITDVFRFPTLGGLAAHIAQGGAAPQPPSAPVVDEPARAEAMSRRKAMREARRMKAQ